MELIILSGPSGSGKTIALHSLEDAGWFTTDNMPPSLLPHLIEFCKDEELLRCAVVTDVRSGTGLTELEQQVADLKKKDVNIQILFLDTEDRTLVSRFKECRRPHPIYRSSPISIMNAIQIERKLLEPIRSLADRIIDTTHLTPPQLRAYLHELCSPDSIPGMLISVNSFGFKFGLPVDADLVFDVRFLSNPHYVPSLQDKDGRDPEVAAYIMGDSRTPRFMEYMNDLIDFTLPQYEQEGKAYLNIAIGCTGGRHRSVMIAELLADRLKQLHYKISISHRDLAPEEPPVPPVREPGL